MKFITYKHIVIALHNNKAHTLFDVSVLSAPLDDVVTFIDDMEGKGLDDRFRLDQDDVREELRNEIEYLDL